MQLDMFDCILKTHSSNGGWVRAENRRERCLHRRHRFVFILCVFIYIYIHIFLYICVYMCVGVNIYTHVCTYIHIHVYTNAAYVHTHVYTYIYTHIHIPTYIYIYICMSIHQSMQIHMLDCTSTTRSENPKIHVESYRECCLRLHRCVFIVVSSQ